MIFNLFVHIFNPSLIFAGKISTILSSAFLAFTLISSGTVTLYFISSSDQTTFSKVIFFILGQIALFARRDKFSFRILFFQRMNHPILRGYYKPLCRALADKLKHLPPVLSISSASFLTGSVHSGCAITTASGYFAFAFFMSSSVIITCVGQ